MTNIAYNAINLVYNQSISLYLLFGSVLVLSLLIADVIRGYSYVNKYYSA
jgi:hypothetical protein